MYTMNEKNRNPVIRVYPHTRQKLKIIAAMCEETMQDTVERLAQEELDRRNKVKRGIYNVYRGEHRPLEPLPPPIETNVEAPTGWHAIEHVAKATGIAPSELYAVEA